MLAKLRTKIELRLHRSGFATAEVRRIVSGQILLALVCLAMGAALLPFSVWPFFFGAGAAIAAHNVWWLARSVEKSMRHEYTRGLALANLLAFLARFACAGIAVYICLVPLKAPVVPLLAGLTTLAASLAIKGPGRAGQTPKEASHGR